MNSCSYSAPQSRPCQPSSARPWRLRLAGVAAMLRTWRERSRQRRHLLALDARLLKDAGISREQALREGNKPFWRP